MNPGLIKRALRELLAPTLIFGVALGLVVGILSFVLPTFSERFSAQMAQLQVMQTIIKTMVGVDTPGGGGEIGPEIFTSIPFAHPVILALLWAHAIVCCTRVPAGEVDRGTIDLLLGLPISRRELFVSETAAWLISMVVLFAGAAIGCIAGNSRLSEGLRPSAARIAMVLPMIVSLYMCVGGLAWLVSSLSDRRGKAMSVAFLVVLASFLLNYLAQFWDPAKNLVFLSMLNYYKPFLILRDGAIPWKDLVVLFVSGVVLWVIGGVFFSRRDLATL